jgi:hypothetical protein
VSIRWRRGAEARTSEDFAWACLAANLAGVPGMGTLMAREWWPGLPQLALSVAAGILLTWWFAAFVIAFLPTLEFPPPGAPPLALLAWCSALFAITWTWALASSVRLLRAAGRAK